LELIHAAWFSPGLHTAAARCPCNMAPYNDDSDNTEMVLVVVALVAYHHNSDDAEMVLVVQVLLQAGTVNAQDMVGAPIGRHRGGCRCGEEGALLWGGGVAGGGCAGSGGGSQVAVSSWNPCGRLHLVSLGVGADKSAREMGVVIVEFWANAHAPSSSAAGC